MESIKDRVAIIGMGCTKTGALYGRNVEDLLIEACHEAMSDAGVSPRDIQAGWLGNIHGGPINGLNYSLKLDYTPVTGVSNACATGADVFRTACAYVAAGLYDIVLAAGVEKLMDRGVTGAPSGGNELGHNSVLTPPPPMNFALYATRYMHDFGYSFEELKRALAHIAVKNHRNGLLNPKAALHKEITIREAMEAPMIAWPLGLYDCCLNVDGAAAAIITRPEIARTLRDNYVLVKGVGAACGSHEGLLRRDYSYTAFPENEHAARAAYQSAGIREPLKELGHAQIHDAFTVNEMLVYEDIGFAPRGKAPEVVLSGYFDREGPLPTNTDGGLKTTGHPVSATGLKEIYESYLQLSGQAGPRQLKDVRQGLVHSQGGVIGTFTTVIHILGARD